MNKKLIKQMFKCTDRLVANSDPNRILNEPVLSKIGQGKFKGATSYLKKMKKGCPKKKVCIWEFKTTNWSYRTTCGKKPFFPNYVMQQITFKYCPFCGKKIKVSESKKDKK